jgi:hypothetical protein
LCFAGVLDRLLQTPLNIKVWIPLRVFAGLALFELLLAVAVVIAPNWQPKLSVSMTVDADRSSQQTVDWVSTNLPHNKRVIVESAFWTDLELRGFDQSKQVWLYKTETDPAVKKDIGGWQGIDYVVLNGPTIGSPTFDESFPTVSTAVKHSRVIAQFGRDNQQVRVYEVSHK